jgi:hypothetical protein
VQSIYIYLTRNISKQFTSSPDHGVSKSCSPCFLYLLNSLNYMIIARGTDFGFGVY